jgi:membrane protease YdiL (CAAX protease family)
MKRSVNVGPMRIGESAMVFLVVTLLGLACFYGLRPWLVQAGWSSYIAYLSSLSVVLTVMLVWALAAYVVEGQPLTLKAFLQRNRLAQVNPRVLPWGIGLGIVMFLCTAVFAPLLAEAVSSRLLPLPAGIPDYLNPAKQLSLPLLKEDLIAQGVLPLIPIVLLLNILSEELFWRGMIFPRQELQHGSRTYLLHGVLWAFSHLFQYWMLPPILVGSLALAYAAQRTRSTWVGVIAHMVNNGLPFLLMLSLPA